MKRVWQVRRTHRTDDADGNRRRDRCYQLLLEWTSTPTSEDADESGTLRPRLDAATSSGADHRYHIVA